MAFPLVALSGEEAIAALRRAGFHVRTEAGRLVLRCGHRVVAVPAEEILDAATLRGILRSAGIDYVTLLDNLTTPLPIAHYAKDGD